MISGKWRAAVFVIVTAGIVIVLGYWQQPGAVFPASTVLGSTLWGPLSLLVIPTVLGWASAGLPSRWTKALGLVLTMIVLGMCVYLIQAAAWTQHQL